MDKDYSQKTISSTTSIAIIAIVAAIPLQQAEARGCNLGQQPQFNASKGRCFHP
jgi:hypothetical protein